MMIPLLFNSSPTSAEPTQFAASTCLPDNCIWISNPGQQDSNLDGIGNACTFSQPTSTGYNVVIALGSQITVTFDRVTSSGSTVMTMTPAAAGPTGFEIIPAESPVYYNITTSATFTGQIRVCASYDDIGMTPTVEQGLSLQRYTGTAWVNITTAGYPDTLNDMVCGLTTTLSPFVVAFRSSCCSGRVGDVNGSGDDMPTIGDISTLIDAEFITGNCSQISCLAEADANQSGGAQPACGDLTIGDISTLIDCLFISGPGVYIRKPCL